MVDSPEVTSTRKKRQRRAGASWHRRLLRVAVWARRVKLARVFAIFVFLAAFVSATFTFYVLSSPNANSTLVWILLNVDLLIILLLGGLVIRSVLRLWLKRRNRRASSRLHLRLTVLFSLVAIVPSIVLAIFLALTFWLGFESWFDQKVSTAIEESQEVAQSYLDAHKKAIAGEVALLANELNRVWYQLPDRSARERYLNRQIFMRGLSEVVIFAKGRLRDDHLVGGEILARAGFGFSPGSSEMIPSDALARAESGDVVVLPGQANDQVRAFVELSVDDTFLYIARFVDPQVSDHIRKAEAAAAEYLAFKDRSGQLQFFYFFSYLVVSLLMLLAAIWAGLTIATRLVNPIIQLIDAAELVGEGNLSVRVPELSARDEVALLGRAFNRMTARINSQHSNLTAANRELDERRRFTETVLSGVSAGVIGVDAAGRIDLPNPSAKRLLNTDLDAWVGRFIGDVLPPFGDLLKDVQIRPDRSVEREVELTVDKRFVTLRVRASAECSEQGVTGYVFTFDDMTELQAAQRKAAWADVARRIAHEIKNPLTPIQLSAERLKRKYLSQITESPETFERCTDIIIRHVSDIGQMVDEFSAFARMPIPEMADVDLVDLLSQAVFLQQTAYTRIEYETRLPETPVVISADARQIMQALTNLLKNAVESIEGRNPPKPGEPELPPGKISVSLAVEGAHVRVRLTDNGRGLPEGMEMQRLTEPYVTTRAKGTGLGLAIVKKILEDHSGGLMLEDNPDVGVTVTVSLPAKF